MASLRSPSRKRGPSPGRPPSRSRARRRALIGAGVTTSLILAALLVILARSGRLPFASKPVGEAERERIATRVRHTIERAGGNGVWVKEPPYAPFPPARAETATEVIVAGPHFDAVLAAIEAQGASLGLHVRTKVSRSRNQWRRAALRLVRDRALAGCWLLREVPQIRHAAIVVDDLGQDLEAARQLIRMPYPLTFAVLPQLPHSSTTAEESHRAGREVMLHLPMEPSSGAKPGPGEIRVGMGAAEVGRLLDEDLGSVPYAAGVNNHMGSRATTNAPLMTEVIDALVERHLFFIDSRTTVQSVALDVARHRGIPTFFRSVFLDDVETVPYTLGQLREFLRVVEDQDVALAIGHPYPSTLAALEHFLPEFEQHGIQIVPASHLLRLPVIAHLEPAHAIGP